MRIAIVQFPGSNCERETMLALKRAGMEPVEFLWNEDPQKLMSCAGFIIVGGFSYEDRSRAGVIAAFDPIMDVIKAQSEAGKPVLGICNGAQILVETGLVPGLEKNKVAMALTDNKRMQAGKILGAGFYNAWVHMRVTDHFQLNAFTRKVTPKNILQVPVAHGEGRFVIPPALLLEMQTHGLNVFQYCDATGNIDGEFPINPNGSINNIAAVSNKAGNVMAMMPHPERTSNGDVIFQSMRDYIESGYVQRVAPLRYHPRITEMSHYRLPKDHHECIVDLIITDNHAMTVQNTLHQSGIPVQVKRSMHWEVACDSQETFEKAITTGVIYNDRKEKLRRRSEEAETINIKTILVRPKEDILGQQKQQMLEDHFQVHGIHTIRHGVLWQIEGSEHFIHQAINSSILFNGYAHDCYYY